MMVGRLSRAAAMMVPGIFLSQPGSETLPSYHCGAHDGLNGVSNQVSRKQRSFHALGAHGDAIGDADGVEDQADQPGVGRTDLDLLGQLIEVHVTGVAFPAHAGNADLWFLHVLVGQAHAVEHSLRADL